MRKALVVLLAVGIAAGPILAIGGAPVSTASAQQQCSGVGYFVDSFVTGSTGISQLGTCEEGGNYESELIQQAKENNAIDDEQTVTDLKALAASQMEMQDLHLGVRQNYLTDSEAAAWAQAEAAMVRHMEENPDATEAAVRQAGVEAISDYYSRHQHVLKESWDGSLSAAEYINRVAENESGIDPNIVAADGDLWNGSTNSETVMLANGTQVPAKSWETEGGFSGSVPSGPVKMTSGTFEGFEDGNASSWTGSVQAVQDHTFTGQYAGYLGDGTQSEITLPQSGPDSLSWSARFSPEIWGTMELHAGGSQRLDLPLQYGSDGYNADGSVNLKVRNSTGEIETTDVRLYPEQWYRVNITGLGDGDSDITITITDRDGAEVGTVSGSYLENTGSIDTFRMDYWGDSSYEQQGPVWVDAFAVNGGQINEISKLYVKGTSDSDPQDIVRFAPYGDLWSDIEDTETRLTDNFAEYANSSYDSWQSGELDPEDYISASTMASQYATDYNSTGYMSWAAASLSSLGMAAPNLTETGHMVVDYAPADPANSSYSAGKYTGLVMSSDGPTYGSNSSMTDGRWYTGVEYDSSEINGTQTLITSEGEQIPLEGSFTLTKIADRNGEEIASVGTQSHDYTSYSSDDYQERLDGLADLRAQLESLETQLSVIGPDGDGSGSGGLLAGLGLGGLLSGTIAGLPIALIIVLLGAFLILTN